MPFSEAKFMGPASGSGILKNAVFPSGILRDPVLKDNINLIKRTHTIESPGPRAHFPLRFSGGNGGGRYTQ